MKIHKIICHTYAEGPGCRFCIWVQGCNNRCNGCFATELWDYNAGQEMSIENIILMLKGVKDNIDGITFLGGEPFDKAGDLAVIAEYAHLLNKTVITFTGYTYEDIKNKSDDISRLLNQTDLLIDGRFEKALTDFSRPLVGSSNQRFIYLSDKISERDIASYKNRIEVRADNNGKVTFNGMGNIKKLQELILK